MSDETEAELKILEAAKFVFERDGYAGARMQAIADEASLSKSLLHYYFRSKEKLFDRIFDETMEAFMAIVATWDDDNEDWEAKLRRFISSLFTFLRHKSLLFILRELNRNPDLLVKKRAGKSKHKRNRFIVYMEQLQATGRVMQSVDPRMIYMAMHSSALYPSP
ncbi:MAG: helix-turn-helix domain-containing protein [Bacteroidia bacterium]